MEDDGGPRETTVRNCVDAEFAYVVPDATDDGWACADLESAGFDREETYHLVRRIASGKYDDLHGFLLVKDGSLVLEEYFGSLGRVRVAVWPCALATSQRSASCS